MSKGGEIYLLDMGSSVKILDLAKTIINLAGFGFYMNGQNKPNGNSIEISYSGLRPGEKLYEELLVDDSSSKSEHSSIFLENNFSMDPIILKKYLKNIKQACSELDEEKIIRILSEMPLEYSKQADFEPQSSKIKGKKKGSKNSISKEFMKHITP